MKNKVKFTLTVAIAGIHLLGCLILNCQNLQDLPTDFENAMDLKINADLKLIFGSIAVLDAKDGLLVSGQTFAAFRKEIKDSAMIISIEGKRVDTAVFTGGMFQFALNKGYSPPLDLPVVVWASGYDTFYTVITFSEAQQQQFTFTLNKKTLPGTAANNAPVAGLNVKDTVLGVIGTDNKVPATMQFSTATSRSTELNQAPASTDLITTITIPQGTVLYNKNGEPLQGEVAAQSGYFDVSNPTVYSNLPGSRLTTASGTNPNATTAVSALGGIPVQVSGVPGTSGTEQTSFVSAGLLSLDMTVNGVAVDSFSQPIAVTMEMADSIINPSTGMPIKGGDTIDLWSIEKNGTTWQWEGKVAIKGPAVNGKLRADFVVKHLSYWNLDWYYSAVCYYDTLKVTGVPNDIDLYVEPAIIYPYGGERNYYYRQKMDGTGSTRTMIFMNTPKGYLLKFRFYTSQYGALAFQDTSTVSNNCLPIIFACPSGLVSDQLKLKVIATDSTGKTVDPQWLYLYGNVQGSYQSFSAYSENDTFDINVPASIQSTISIYSNSNLVGTTSISGKNDPAITGGILKIKTDIPAKCLYKVTIKGAMTGSYLYLNATLDSKGAYPRQYNQYFYISQSDTTIVLDQFLKNRYVKFSLYYVRGMQIPLISDYEIFMNEQLCALNPTIDLGNFLSRPKIVLHNTSTGRIPVDISIRTYPPAIPGSTIPGNTPYEIFTRTGTTDTVFYPEALPAIWPVEIIVKGTHYDSCSVTRVVEVGRMNKQIIDASYVNWTKSITVNIDGSKLNVPDIVSIPINISIRCTKLEITPSISFYYRLNCPSQNWSYGYLSMGQATLLLIKGRTYEFGVYDPETGALRSGIMTISDELISRANAAANGVNLYDEVTSPELKATLDSFCSRMGG